MLSTLSWALGMNPVGLSVDHISDRSNPALESPPLKPKNAPFVFDEVVKSKKEVIHVPPAHEIDIIEGCMESGVSLAHIAYALSDVSFIYPITSSGYFGEALEHWALKKEHNSFGQTGRVAKMQTRAGAGSAIHSALRAGAVVSGLTSSQALPLMLPSLHSIARDGLPCVLHVSTHSVDADLSVRSDHTDVMAARQSGFVLLSSHSAQEAADLGVVAHAATLLARVPFLHFFDGPYAGAGMSKVRLLSRDQLAKTVDHEAVVMQRAHAHVHSHHHHSGGGGGAGAVADIVDGVMEKLSHQLGRRYRLFEYQGSEHPELLVVVMGSGAAVMEETTAYLSAARGTRVGVVKVHMFRPWSPKHFLQAVPSSVKRVCVLDRCADHTASGDPLFLDVTASFHSEHWLASAPQVVAARYGLHGTDFSPAQAKTVFEKLACPTVRFDLHEERLDAASASSSSRHTAMARLAQKRAAKLNTLPAGTAQALFWSLASEGGVEAGKASLRVLGRTASHVQGEFAVDQAGVVNTHIRVGPAAPAPTSHHHHHHHHHTRSQYGVSAADYVSVSTPALLLHYDVQARLKDHARLVLSAPWTTAELEAGLPPQLRHSLARRHIQMYTIDAAAVAAAVGWGEDAAAAAAVMQLVFFRLCDAVDLHEVVGLLMEEGSSSSSSSASVLHAGCKLGLGGHKLNYATVAAVLRGLHKVEYPEAWLRVTRPSSSSSSPASSRRNSFSSVRGRSSTSSTVASSGSGTDSQQGDYPVDLPLHMPSAVQSLLLPAMTKAWDEEQQQKAEEQQPQGGGDSPCRILPRHTAAWHLLFPSAFQHTRPATAPSSSSSLPLSLASSSSSSSSSSGGVLAPQGHESAVLSVHKRLTPDDYDRNTFHLEVDLSGTDVRYETGDALSIYPQNESRQVAQFLSFYGLDGEDLVATRIGFEEQLAPGSSRMLSVAQLFTQVLDIFGRPNKKFYRALAAHATNPQERKALERLVSEEGKAEYAQRTEATTHFVDLLREFPSAHLPLHALMEVVPQIEPRLYSIASSDKVHPRVAHLLVVLEDWKTPWGMREGLCSHYLSTLHPEKRVNVNLEELIYGRVGAGIMPKKRGRGEIRVTTGSKEGMLKMPSDHSVPVMMVGLGTGLAPFRGMVQERAYAMTQGMEIGEMALYFGARFKAKENFYGEELSRYHHAGVLSHYRPAFSRDQAKKIYVQDLIAEDAETVYRMMVEKGGYFYLCGPKGRVPEDVRAALLKILEKVGGMKPQQAEETIDTWKKEGRYVLEVY